MTKALELRKQNIQSLKTQKFDVIVIGGGASGIATAVDAANKGYKALLVEKYDFAKGTSSRSTKILHGGVRYLAQANFKLVREALIEKNLVYQNAPHLSKKMDFIIPCNNLFEQVFYRSGMVIYDLLGGSFIRNLSSLLFKNELKNILPEINHTKIPFGVRYSDGQFDDARLALSLVKTFESRGGIAFNYLEVKELIKENNKLIGVKLRDSISGEELKVLGDCIINATGIFSDEIRNMDNHSDNKSLTFAQGIHIVVSKKVYSSPNSMVIPKTSDGRVLFFVPWKDHVIIGTTDTKVDSAEIEPLALSEEIELILNNANQYLQNKITKSDIISLYAGIRPLPKADKNSSKISRDEVIHLSSSGLISVIGGKWTTYRKIGERIVDFAINKGCLQLISKNSTKTMPLSDYVSHSELENIPEQFKVYGKDYFTYFKDSNQNSLHKDVYITSDMIKHAVINEKALYLEDVLSRRTRLLFLNLEATKEVAPLVAKEMADILGHDQAWIDNELNKFNELAKHYDIRQFELNS